jgi:hypothetical protein
MPFYYMLFGLKKLTVLIRRQYRLIILLSTYAISERCLKLLRKSKKELGELWGKVPKRCSGQMWGGWEGDDGRNEEYEFLGHPVSAEIPVPSRLASYKKSNIQVGIPSAPRIWNLRTRGKTF